MNHTGSGKIAVIAGAGPAGLTAALELLEKTDIIPIVVEATDSIGGISRTVNFEGNRIDIGGHRFFSKSDRIMDWWGKIMPVQSSPSIDDLELDRKISGMSQDGPDPETEDLVLLIRKRLSRIFFLGNFFDYPLSLSPTTIGKLGLWRTTKMGFSYLKCCLTPSRKENSLEDFFINRFGYELYATFFKDYTEKVWGVPCTEISPEWGAQRIKGLSIARAIYHSIKKLFSSASDINQKDTETSLIDRFYYPKLGPGQLWEEVARKVESLGGKVVLNAKVIKVHSNDFKVKSVEILYSEESKDPRENKSNSRQETLSVDYFFSSMPVPALMKSLGSVVPQEIVDIANGLVFRDFITVGILLEKLDCPPLPDTWIYVQESGVHMGRIQVFNNWSPYLLKDRKNTWLGLEYFCTEGDSIWEKNKEELIELGITELEKMGLASKAALLSATVIRSPKTYPCYFGSYDSFKRIREYTDQFSNMYLVGRNGTHKYNNSDHSMLTAIEAVDNIVNKRSNKTNIWDVNTEKDYHEEK
jgi:protoporphyrinogen oxidase